MSILHTDSPTDWQITFDFNNNSTIPTETSVDTLQRPDIVIYSVSKKRLIWLENTVPLERNIVAAQLRKVARYQKLKTAIMLKGWSVEDFTIEIGALGFVAKSFDFALRQLGFGNSQKKIIRKVAAKLSLRSSYYIWCNRFSHNFSTPKLTPEPKSNTFPPLKQTDFKRTHFCPREVTTPKIKLFSTPKKIPKHTPPSYKYFTPTGDAPKVQHISPLSTFSKLKKEINSMSPIDSTLWNGMENYSPRSQKWLKSEIPLYNLDQLMGLNPFLHSLKFYDPTGSITLLSSKEIKSEDTKEVIAPMGRVSPEEKEEEKKFISSEVTSHFPTKISDLEFGAPPEIDYDDDFSNYHQLDDDYY